MISKKKILNLELALTGAFNEVLKEHFNKHDIGGTPWYECQPEMWTPEEREIFDAMTDLQIKFMEKVKEIV